MFYLVGLFNSFVLAAQSALMPRLVKDFNTNTESTLFINGSFAVLDGVVYFPAADPGHGTELWRSDGTEAGTWMVIDLVPGAAVHRRFTLPRGTTLFGSARRSAPMPTD